MQRFAFLVCALLAVVSPANATPTEAEVAGARLDFLGGQYDSLLTVLLPAAEAGNPVAQDLMGVAYEDGKAVPQDFAAAVQWYLRAADQGLAMAQYNLGLILAQGRVGVEVDVAAAIRYLDMAVAQGYGPAMTERGLMHENGLGGPVDMAAAVDLLQRASDLGDARGSDELAVLLDRGATGRQDPVRAHALFVAAALKGAIGAVNNLAEDYLQGRGVPVDKMAAMALFQFGADQGNTRSAVNLAGILVGQDITWGDPATGYAWCLSAVRRADSAERDAFSARCSAMGELLDDATRAEAEALAPNLPR